MAKFVIAGTGSRELVQEQHFKKVEEYLAKLLTQAKTKHGDNLQVISGMAEGFDEALACAAILAKVNFVAALPNRGYLDYYWGKKSLLGRNRITEAQEIISKANDIVCVCDGIYGPDGRHANFHRNEWMVDHADIVWVYNPTTRGTAQCYSYCVRKGQRTFLIKL